MSDYPASVATEEDGFTSPATIGGTLAVRYGTFDYTDIAAKELFTLPQGAVPIDWYIDITTDFDAGTTNPLDIGIDTDPDYFANDLDIGTAGVIRNGATNYVAGRIGVQLVVDSPVEVLYIPTGTAATQGEATLFMLYMVGTG